MTLSRARVAKMRRCQKISRHSAHLAHAVALAASVNGCLDGVDAPQRHLCAKVEVLPHHLREASVEKVSIIGLDIAKSVFQAHGADASGAVVFRKKISRAKLLEFFASQ